MSRSFKAFLLIVGQGLNVLVNFLFLPYLARALPIEQYGMYGQVLLISDLIKVLASMGLASIIFIYFSNVKYQKSTVYNSNLLIAFILGALGSLLVYLLSPYVEYIFNSTENIGYFVRIYSLSILFSVPFLSVNSTLIYLNKIKTTVIILVFSNLFKLILLIISIQHYNSMTLLFSSIVLVSIIQFIWGYLSIPADFRRGSYNLNLGLLQIKDGFYIGLSKMLGIFLIYTDSFMVSAMLSVEEYAIFRNGAIEIPLIAIVYGSVATILLPEVAKMIVNKNFNELAKMKRRAINATAAIIYPPLIFFLIFSKPVITTYLSERYELSASVFLVYNLIVLFRINSYHDIIINSSKRSVLSKAYFYCLLLNMLLNYFMIQHFGYLGAAVSSVVSISLLLLYLASVSASIIGKSITDFFDFKHLIKLLFVPILLSFFLLYVYKYFPKNYTLPIIALLIILSSYLIYLKLNWLDNSFAYRFLNKSTWVRKFLKK